MTGANPSRALDIRRALPVLSFLLLASCAPVVAQTGILPVQEGELEGGTIRVSGQAQLTVPADRVRISFSVETEAASARDATQLNAQRMDEVISALRGGGFGNLEIETYGYSLRPEYEVQRESSGGRVISGYRVQNNVRVVLSDVEAAGALLDVAIGGGANRVAGLVFEASDTREARLQALREAVATAREEAETIASAMGVGLGPAVEVQGGASAPAPRVAGEMMVLAESARAPTPIEAGSQTVSASVTITYRILERAP